MSSNLGNPRPYEAARTLMQLTCESCHLQVTIDPTNKDDVESTADWIMIVPSNGVKIAVHSKECGIKTLHKLPRASGVVLAGE